MPAGLTHKSKSMSAFNVLPTAYFAEIDPDEKTLLMLRAHPVTQIPWIFNLVVGFVFLFVFDIFLARYITLSQTIRTNIIAIVFLLAYGWYNFLIWYYTVGFVTNKRIIDIDYYGIIKRVVTQAPIVKLSDVTARVAGFFGQIYNFGDVHVMTEGTLPNIEFTSIPDPDETVAIINDAGTEASEIRNNN